MSNKRIAVAARRTITETVTAAFLPAEASAEAAAVHGANCLSVIMAERAKAMLPPSTAADALVLISIATTKALEAHRSLAEAHRELAAIPAEFGMSEKQGPDCPDEFFFTGATLRSVA